MAHRLAGHSERKNELDASHIKKSLFLQIIIRTRTEGAGWDITRHEYR